MDLFPKIEMDLIEETPDPLDEENESDEEEIKEVIEEKEPSPKPVIKQEDIFQDKKPIIKPIKEDKPPKKKRVMSEEQKERLRLGREKALANRRAKAQEKKEVKELQTKKKQKEIQELKDYVNDVPSGNNMMPSVSEEEIEKRTQKAIKLALMEHEEERQKRKAIKKEKQKKESQEAQIKDMVINASLYNRPAPRYGDADFFDSCFQ
jgi:hypothetical protein